MTTETVPTAEAEPTTPPEANQTPADQNEDSDFLDYKGQLEQLRLEHAGKMDEITEDHLAKLSRVRVGHEAMMLQDAQKTLRYDRDSRDRGMDEIYANDGGSSPVPPQTNGGDQKTPTGILAGMEDMINLGEIHIEQPRDPNAQPQQVAPVQVQPVLPVPEPQPQPQPEQPQPEQPQPEQPSVKKKLGKLAKAGIAAALIGSGVGSGVGGKMLWDVFTKGDDKPPVVNPTIDTDTYYELRLHPPGNNR